MCISYVPLNLIIHVYKISYNIELKSVLSSKVLMKNSSEIYT